MYPKEKIEILQKAKEILSKPGAWLKRTYARTETGISTWGHSPNAVCWCAIGAVQKATLSPEETKNSIPDWTKVQGIWDELDRTIGDVTVFNDAQETVEPVLEVFDKTIARLESL
jgi:hypothetical protein